MQIIKDRLCQACYLPLNKRNKGIYCAIDKQFYNESEDNEPSNRKVIYISPLLSAREIQNS